MRDVIDDFLDGATGGAVVALPPRHTPLDGVPDEVLDLFERFAFDIIDSGFKRYSSDAILHRIRWHMQVERKDREFKCNDHWTAPLARWFMAKHPSRRGFFETRERHRDAEVA